jgi:hypothetical protein
MQVYVAGDIHGCCSGGCTKLNTTNWPEQNKLTSQDLLIILGDFGLFWSHDLTDEELYWINWLLNKKCQVAFIDGNHERHPLINSFPVIDKWDGYVHDCYTNKTGKSLYHLIRGEVYTFDKYTSFVMGGAYSIDKLHRKEGISWWPEEIANNSEWRNADIKLNEHDNQVDYILTHTCSKKILEYMGFGGYLMEKFNDPTAIAFDSIVDTVKFREWHFGHFHKDINYKNKFYCHYNNKPYKLF